MNNLFFKSPKRLIKNDSISSKDYRINYLVKSIGYILIENRHQRSDLHDIKLMLNKLIIDKHLQYQVDEFFEKDETSPQTDSDEQ